MHKDFDRWNAEKKQLQVCSRRPAFVSEREIWWGALGVNVGREQDGRGDHFERPIVILKVLSPDTFVVLPLSTKRRMEVFQSEVTHGTIRGFALLDQIRVLDAKRLRRKIGTMGRGEFQKIREKVTAML